MSEQFKINVNIIFGEGMERCEIRVGKVNFEKVLVIL